MRNLLAAALPFALTGCFGSNSEPLQSTAGLAAKSGGERNAPAAVTKLRSLDYVPSFRFAGHSSVEVDGSTELGTEIGTEVGNENTDPAPGDVTAEEPAQPTFEELAVAEIAATVQYASVRAFAAAEAGAAHDKDLAVAAAADLANAAALCAQRADEIQVALANAGDGVTDGATDGCADGATDAPAVDDAVADAVFAAALAAEEAGDIADTLDPPSSTVCSGGCHPTCEEVPGTVDENELALAVEDVRQAGQDCAAAAEVIAL